MSGIEVAGVLLGAFPLIISGLEHWRDVAKVGGFFWRIRKEYSTCRRDVQYHEILYKRNLKELLLPIVEDENDVPSLISDPGGTAWSDKALQTRLEERLHESYAVYVDIIQEMNDTAEELKKELVFEKGGIQSTLALVPIASNGQSRPSSPFKPSKLGSAKSKWDYETFRIKFSLNEPVRLKLFQQLEECNKRLEKLLSTSDKITSLENAATPNTKQANAMEIIFNKTRKNSEFLFKAIQRAWQCPCQHHHVANLRLEHRTVNESLFGLILMSSTSPSDHAHWSWKELQCGQSNCSACQHLSFKPNGDVQSIGSYPTMPTTLPIRSKQKKVAFTTTTLAIPQIKVDAIEQCFKLCDELGKAHGKCMGSISHDEGSYHLQPVSKKRRPSDNKPLTLDHILSGDFEGNFSRRQRYYIALLLASSIAQLQSTPWLNSSLRKEDVLLFPCLGDDNALSYDEPFLRQGFPLNESSTTDPPLTSAFNFSTLGILLLELCFGRRLDDDPTRKKHASAQGDAKHAFDLITALKWAQRVGDEGGADYAAAVRWCFLPGTQSAGHQSWRSEIIRHVIRPLEKCQEYFRAVAAF